VAGGAVSVAQAYWPTNSNTNYANAWEIYPIKPYQTHYTIPVGEDMYGPTYWDRFSAQSYSNSDGTTNWSSTPWVESGAGTDTSATGGIIWVTTGGKLRFEGYATTVNLSRPVALGAPVTDAYLSFDYTINDTLEAADTLAVQVSMNGGGTWTTLQTMAGTGLSASGSRSFDLGGYLNANTQIRFAVTGFTDGTEYLEIDNVKIRYTTTAGGTPVASSYRDFLNVFVFAQATADGTAIEIDDPQAAGTEVSVKKNRGETVYLGHIFAGTTVSATAPVQVQFLIGEDIVITNQNNSRSYTAVPSGLWSTSYYSPVPGDLGGVGETGWQGPYRTDLYIYNPSASSLTINYEDVSGTGTFTVTAGATEAYSDPDNANRTVPANSGVYIAAADGTTKFWAIGAMAASDPTWNWGYTLLPPETLTDEYYVSWAPGGWNQGTAQPVNSSYSPIFVTPVEDNTTVFVDYSPADGTVDATYVLNRIQVQRVYDQAATGHTQDADNTGTHIWATGPIALAWGEDPDAAAAASPGLDAGYTILPMNKTWIDVVLDLEKTADPAIIPDLSGQTSVFTLVVETGDYAVDNVVVTDTLPANWSYVSGSTTITLPDSSTISGASVDPDTSGQDLIWDAFPSGPLDMAANQTLTIEFTAITTAAPGGASVNNALTTGTYGGITLTADDFATVDISALEIEKISSAGGSVEPGDTIGYTILITNTGTGTQNNIVVSDTLPAGTSYVAQSTQVSMPATGTFSDSFDAVNYSNSYGTLSWTTSWIETGDDGLPNNNGNDIDIQAESGSNRLHLQDDTNGIYRSINLSAYGSATLTFDRKVVSLEAGEAFYLDIYNGTSWQDGVLSWTGPLDEISYTSETVDLTSYISADTRIRFRSPSGGMNNGDDIYLDNVVISVPSGRTTKDNNPSSGNPQLVDGVPSDLVGTADSFDLPAGQTMTVTFRVTVDDPVPVGQAGVVNTVAVSSDEEPAPLEDTVVDVLPLATIGNTVWLDEDGDGDQDAGEVGIPNVVVELYNANRTLVMTTTTDASGGYLFDGVVIGTYTVTVKTSTMPAGLAANPTYDEDDGTTNPDSETVVTLTTDSEEHMTTDFGYNWASPTETNNPGGSATGAIGDRVWIDANGDGAQDPGEPGLGGVTVRLYTDSDGDGVYDNLAGTTTTDAAGNHIFDGLAAGAYVVEVNGGSAPSGYTQTGDPDYFGATLPSGARDNRTTTPIVLAPGDVFVNADFGYQPTAGNGGNIGDTLWVDADRDNILDAGEPRLAGVTVVLIRDLDGDGVWDAGEPIIASDITDVNGQYLFTGLPVTDGGGTDDYLVWVNDTGNVLYGLVPTYDSNGVGTPNLSAASNLTSSGDLSQDFAYAPPDHDNGEGLIGDTIFYDRDADNAFDSGEGLEGVRVRLYRDNNNNNVWDAGDTLLASTWTDENGNYFFGGLAAGEYVVRADTATLPAGVTNTVDPDTASPGDSQSAVTLTSPSSMVNLAQDFGYRDTSGPNSISGTIWEDTNADGTLSGESGCFQGVTVVLRDSSGDIVATTTTDASGNYSFTNLPDGTYTVDVTDDGNVLNGYWHSDGPNNGSDNNSQDDPYTVTVTGGQNNTTADFGYYVDPAAVGNFVWLDRDSDGVQDADEPSIKGVTVVLIITYPNSTVVTVTTVTGDDGAYSFGNLLLDEDFDGAGSGEPAYSISVSYDSAVLTASLQNQTTEDKDSDNPAGEAATVTEGASNLIYDFGFYTIRLDLGDLPEGYYTLFLPGPAHVIFPDSNSDNKPESSGGVEAVWLGQIVDVETNGQPTPDADGDDDGGNDDEDGLTFPSAVTPGSMANFVVTVNASASAVTVYFGMWIDWNNDDTFDAFYDGSGVTGSPTPVTVTVSVPLTYTPGNMIYVRVRAGNFPLSQSNSTGTIINGEVEDYQKSWPTAVTLSSLTAVWDGDVVRVEWETALELDTVGFNVWRSTDPAGGYVQINDVLIPAESLGGVWGGAYSYVDSGVTPGTVYYYRLEELEVSGARNWYGPTLTEGGHQPTAVTLRAFAASGGGIAGAGWVVTGAIALGAGLIVFGRLRKRR
jgi:uncharacterized repeat protein (TIGR01451 family)